MPQFIAVAPGLCQSTSDFPLLLQAALSQLTASCLYGITLAVPHRYVDALPLQSRGKIFNI